ncbi:MAG TPA: hypothetical protein DHI91_00715 [Candidatus Portnoybacteria bacterium]|uniref:Uncharacterized protein n=1 Tax=Candidatus Portnoybacteria bacterium CG02_land_8_20_14_3_00_45_8 TaxID=1974807 RepID=A0A2M7D694_9BACT|nr:MAG: hypothetical protein COS30_01515 [Candidatus Portnoybacteria bacterium CG02_land_8_20_14_3_00_45_8]HCX27646.1 hypothetical protein [Candidatus Portnoybacteria bacterium]
METAKEKFLKVYANLPLGIREEIILILEGKPITWNVAYLEVNNNTKNSQEILRKLEELKIL